MWLSFQYCEQRVYIMGVRCHFHQLSAMYGGHFNRRRIGVSPTKNTDLSHITDKLNIASFSVVSIFDWPFGILYLTFINHIKLYGVHLATDGNNKQVIYMYRHRLHGKIQIQLPYDTIVLLSRVILNQFIIYSALKLKDTKISKDIYNWKHVQWVRVTNAIGTLRVLLDIVPNVNIYFRRIFNLFDSLKLTR